MADNKFLTRLKGKQAPKSSVQIDEDKLSPVFGNMSVGSDGIENIIEQSHSSTVVAKGAQNWYLSGNSMVLSDSDQYTSEFKVNGQGLWVNSSYTFTSASVIAPSAKWVLRFCGDNLLDATDHKITLSAIIKAGSTTLASKTFVLDEQANFFCKVLEFDLDDTYQSVHKFSSGSTLTVQLLCANDGASATIYNGKTTLTLLQRMVDADTVAFNGTPLIDVMTGHVAEDYFNRYQEQVVDGDKGMPVFSRAGTQMELAGWEEKTTVQVAEHNTSEEAHEDIRAEVATKQDQLTAGYNITIDENNVISATSQISTLFSDLLGSPYDNENLAEALNAKADETDLQAHIDDKTNPHEVTKAQVGLGNADNTADLDKPISTATQAALDLKADDSDLQTHIADTDNPHSVTKAQVGLGNVDNTSDANKPISTATQTALDAKQDTISDLSTIRSNASAGKSASDTIATYGNIVTHNTSEFATSAQGALADSALQSGDNVSELTNDSGYITKSVNNLENYTDTSTLTELLAGKQPTGDYATNTALTQGLATKQDTISDLTTIRNNASAGKTASDTIATYGDIVTHDTLEFATASQGALADTALQSGDNVSELTNDAGYVTSAYHDSTKQDVISDLSTIRSGATAGSTAIQPDDNISELTNDSNYQNGSQVTASISAHNTSTSAHSDIRSAISAKQDQLTAGTNVDITDNVISATDTTYSAGNGLTLTGTTFSANVIDTTTSDSTINALSARVGKVLQEQINNLNTRGKYLSIWNCTTGLAMDTPPVDPYTYETGSFFIVGVVASAGGTNYKPSGSTYSSSTPSTVVETEPVKPNDTYYYDGTTWRLLATQGGGTVAFSSILGSPYDNTNLSNALDAKQATLVSGTNIKTVNSTSLLGNGNIAVQPTITGGATTITSSNLTENRALISNGSGKVAVSDITSTELGYLDGVTSAIQTQLNGKQATISDLATIRSGAQAGSTAVQPSSLATVATSGSYNDLSDKPTIPSIDSLLGLLYPVGSIYIGTQSTCPLSTLIPGSTWAKVSGDKVLQTSSSSHSANSTIEAGLPNITGDMTASDLGLDTTSGAFTNSGSGRGIPGSHTGSKAQNIGFDASLSNPIYGKSTTVQPPAYVVNVWRRTA